MGNIRYINIANPAQAAGFVAEKLVEHLRLGHKILWLVPGGSAMIVAALAASQVDKQGLGAGLSVTLTDERYGRPGHKDSNWRQLMDKEFLIKDARMLPVLQGADLDETAASYGEMLNRELSAADYTLALAGMGDDGHIFGIKPGSQAVNSRQYVIGYVWDDFIRLTPTGGFIKQVDEIVMYVMGESKRRQLQMLEEDLDPTVQPAQLLKQAGSVTILNDFKGEDL